MLVYIWFHMVYICLSTYLRMSKIKIREHISKHMAVFDNSIWFDEILTDYQKLIETIRWYSLVTSNLIVEAIL